MSSKVSLSDAINKKIKFESEKSFSINASIMKALVIIIFFGLIFYGMYIYSSYERLKRIWPMKKCSPDMVYLAPLFKPKSDPRSVIDYTYENFKDCTHGVLKTVVVRAFAPINFIFRLLTDFYNQIITALIQLKNLSFSVSAALRKVLDKIMNKIKAIIVPFQKIILVLKDSMNKTAAFLDIGAKFIQGMILTMISAMGAYYNGYYDLIIAFSVTPLTWAIGIPLLPTIWIFEALKNIFKLSGYRAAWPSFCFDKNVIIQTKKGAVKISEIKIGDTLHDNSVVTSRFTLSSQNQEMYSINKIIVSGNHKVFYNKEWIEVSSHPFAKKLNTYKEPFIYCINTTNKRINIGGIIFSDWDDIDDDDIIELNEKCFDMFKDYINEENIHSYLDGGFVKDTKIEVEDGNSVSIQNIEVDDVLYNGEIVTGIVEIDATNLDIYQYTIVNKKLFGGPNLQIVNNDINIIGNTELSKKLTKRKEKKLYHILTNKYSFNMNGIVFLDYNGGIETLLDEDRLNLLENLNLLQVN
jgi:hypothetical protein